ncbi:amino acid adenylation domain-containing protein [Sphingomonas koreensis]|nr:amino acid adenylation domain-containing protein [Sphingomonas koreensis]
MTSDRISTSVACAPVAIADAADDTPGVVAIAHGGATITYADLVARARSLAAALAARGVTRGDLVAVCLPRSIDQIAATLAAWFAGAAYLPLDPAWPEARVSALIADADCAAVIADAALGARIAGGVALVSPKATADAAFAPVATSADDLAYVIFTSGSTGKPKAVEVTHGNLAALIAWHRAAFGVGAGSRTSHLAGLGFDAAAWEVWPTLAAGGTLSLVDDATRLDPAALRDWLVAERIQVAFAPTALAEPMVAMAWPADTALTTLLTGADKLTVRPAPGLPFSFVNNYGPTESTVVATSAIVDADGAGLPPIGRPIAGTHIHLLGNDGAPVTDGEPGEIWIGGAQVARGYRGDATLTAERFVSHPQHGRLYRTGDLGVRLAHGDIAFRGRVDGQIKIRGHRIEPAEIAAALNRLDGVSSSAVIARDGELIAYVVPGAGGAPTAASLREALSASLPDYMVPARFATLAALPLTPNGKIDTAALPDQADCALAEAATGRAPATPTEKRLLGIVAGVIGRQDVGVDDDFFLLGGHSLLGTQVVVQARDAFGVELTLFHLFEGRTVAKLALIIEQLVIEKLDSMSDEDIQRMAG